MLEESFLLAVGTKLGHVISQMSREVAEKYMMPTSLRGLNCSSFSGLPLVLRAQTCSLCDFIILCSVILLNWHFLH
ncbi:hypothetical protein C1H46_039305 [Malus baccata]|uniref:Uncharacterized protein n=1 Tax=Malus baccata TaxID=106549 RepID=A0A540KLQ4_MALBA|nr:hypothetical protein C1H46_039305 [Malus baccata]